MLAGKEKDGLFNRRNVVNDFLLGGDKTRGILRSRERLEKTLEPDFVHMIGQKTPENVFKGLISGYGDLRIIVYSS